MPERLYVIGMARSGTTALAHVLGAHPRVVLGMERYKALWADAFASGGPGLGDELFTRQRFLDLADGLTNVVPAASPVWAEHYRRQAAAWDHAAYVGDKVTRVQPEALWRASPAARLVVLLRDVREVAGSWQARADDPADLTWPAHLDAARAVRRVDRVLARVLDAGRARPGQVAVVEHAAFFGAADGEPLTRLLAWLGLADSPETDAELALRQSGYAAVRDKPRRLDAATEAAAQRVDAGLWREVLALAP